jgi:hypothetical protein
MEKTVRTVQLLGKDRIPRIAGAGRDEDSICSRAVVNPTKIVVGIMADSREFNDSCL